MLIAETESEFSAALVELLQDEKRRVAIATSARRWAEANLDLEQRVLAYERLWERVLAERRGR